MIIIDRESKSSLIKLFKEAKKRLKQGRVVAVFPEGTRGRGDKLLKFRSGSKLLAEKLKLKVQPIVIVGTRALLDSQNFKASLYGKIKVIYLDSIDPNADDGWYEKLYEDMKETLAKHTKLT
jgi:1-acyl-sn-glycerol-3-phosphate acyltransferase